MTIWLKIYIFLSNIVQLIKFFIKKKNCKVLYFKIPSPILLSFLDLDFVNLVSDKINAGLTGNQDDVNKLIKLGWLISNIRKNGVKNPVQLLYVGQGKYFCHPGVDRTLVMTYIDPVKTVEGFYIWYPNIDRNPFVLEYEHEEIKNPFTLWRKFKSLNGLYFSEIRLNKNINILDNPNGKYNRKGSYPWFSTALSCFKKTGKEFDFSFMTYICIDHLEIVEQMKLTDVFEVIDNNTVILSKIKFTKQNDTWITSK